MIELNPSQVGALLKVYLIKKRIIMLDFLFY